MESLIDDEIEVNMRGIEDHSSDCCNTDYFLASATIVECPWSKFDTPIPQQRECMRPMLIEELLFLKKIGAYGLLKTF